MNNANPSIATVAHPITKVSNPPNLDEALAYRARGWPIIPVHPNSKLPLVKWRPYQDTLPTEAEVRQWWAQWPDANVGMITGHLSGLIVIDCDSEEATRRFLESYPGAEGTLQVETGRGRHFYFAWEEGVRTGVGTLGTGIDVRSEGAFVVLPPSRHSNGRLYRWINENTPQPLQGLKEVLLKRNGNRGSTKGGAVVERINEGRRNNTLFSMGYAMSCKRMSQKAIEVALKEENITKCDPPLSEGEIKVIARSAAGYEPEASNGSGKDGGVLLNLTKEGNQANRRRITFSTEEFFSTPIIAQPCLVESLIPTVGVTLLYGKWGLGKSPLTWELACSVASGTPFLGLDTVKGRVAYLEIDSPQNLVRERMEPRSATTPKDIAWSFFYGVPFDCLSPSFSDSIAGKELRGIQADFHPDLVIVNTLRKIHRAEDVKSNVPSAVYGAFQEAFPNAAILFVHHDRKSSKDGSQAPEGEAFSGSQAWLNDAQVGLHLLKAGAQALRLVHTKSQISELLPSMRLKLSEDGSSVCLLEFQHAKAVQTILASLPTGMSKADQDQEIAKRMTISPRSARRIRTSLAK